MYIKVVVPANGLKVNHNDFVALHSIGKYSEGVKDLISSGILYTYLNSSRELNLDMCTIFYSK